MPESFFILILVLLIQKSRMHENVFISASDDGFIKIWNMASGMEAFYKPVKFKCLQLINSNYLAMGAHNGEIYIWNNIQQIQLKILRHNNASINVFLLVNDTILISASEDGSLKLWNTETFEVLEYIDKAHDQGIKTLNLFNTTSFISMSINKLIKEWSLTDFREISKIESNCGSIRSVDVFLKMNLIVGCTTHTRIFDSSNIQLYVMTPETPSTALKVLKYPNVACGLQNGNVFILNIITRELNYRFHAHNATITAIEYMPDDILITGGSDSFIKIWNLTSKVLIKEYKMNGSINDLILGFNFTFDKKIQLKTNETSTREFTTLQTFKNEITKNEVTTSEINTIQSFHDEFTTNNVKTLELSTAKTSNDESTKNCQITTEYYFLDEVKKNESDLLDISNLNKVFDLLKMDLDLNDCLTNCSNQGVCKYFKNVNKYKCDCDVGFFGESCQKDLNPCSSSPCLNEGLCLIMNKSSFKCECLSNYYTGDFCEKEIDLCQNETCSSQGRCSVQNKKPKCYCFNLFSGEKCQIESNDGKVIKQIIKTATIITIIILVSFFLILILIDVSNYFARGKKVFRVKNKFQKLQYFNQ
ncbi:unnamed protein product [Brachionus calyciflorus]|uniref:EGF-like domain-containing protein n=1 Tax=Brachionus calyciflorus TaxID=104777 RepID=A0A814JBL3_9BILA|nr:unnamed protein product [Brachionus calyciflorus]